MVSMNLASFKGIKKKYNKVTNDYEYLRDKNFHQDGYVIGDCSSLWDAMWEYSDLFDEVEMFEIEIKQQLNASSDLKNSVLYENMLFELNQITYKCITDYKEIKSNINDFEDSEKRRMNQFKIDIK